MDNSKMIKILMDGGAGVLLTDTLYGIVGQALDKKTVERIYRVKKRNEKKPFVILISSVEDLKLFGVKIDKGMKGRLKEFWPGAVSIVLPCSIKKFEYLHRGTKTLAFRLPQKKSLIELLRVTGPMIAPSANPEGLPPANGVREAKKYFGDQVDFYKNGGKPKNKPSSIIVMNEEGVKVIRE